MIKPDDNDMYNEHEYNIFMKGFNQGYKIGWVDNDTQNKKLTFKDHYEKLCEEIRESVIEEVLEKLRSIHNE